MPLDKAFADGRLYVAEGRTGELEGKVVGYLQIRYGREPGTAVAEEMVVHPKAHQATASSILERGLAQASLDGSAAALLGDDRTRPSLFASMAPETPQAFAAQLGRADMANGAQGLVGWTEEQVRTFRAVDPDAPVIYAGVEENPDYRWMVENNVAVGVGSAREFAAVRAAAGIRDERVRPDAPRFAVRSQNLDRASTSAAARVDTGPRVPKDLIDAMRSASVTPDFVVVDSFQSAYRSDSSISDSNGCCAEFSDSTRSWCSTPMASR
jgi:hypothetical protein